MSERDTLRFRATVRHDGQAVVDAKVTWSSQNTSVLTIDSTGLATALTTPTTVATTIVAAHGTLQASANVVVAVKPRPTFSVWPDTNVLFPGMTRTLAARTIDTSWPLTIFTVTPTSFATSDATVVTVDPNGQITAVGAGHATVTSTLDDRTATVEVYVVANPSPLRFMAVGDGNVTIKDGPDFYGNRGCGLLAGDGSVYCWGVPLPGMQGPFDRCEQRVSAGGVAHLERYRCSEIPIHFPTSVGFSSLSTDGENGCGLNGAGAAYCWGTNTYGQLGIGATDSDVHGAMLISGGDQFLSIHNYGFTPCAIRTDGAAFCWGLNLNGVAGSGSATPFQLTTPTRVSGTVSWSSIAAAGGCALAADSTAYCWGAYFGPTVLAGCGVRCSASPTPIGGTARWLAIATTSLHLHFCALALSGRVYCWGDAAAKFSYDTPLLVAGEPPLVSLGNRLGIVETLCGLSASGDMFCVKPNYTAMQPADVYSLEALNLGGLKLKRFSGNCGVAVDDKAYCWTTDNVPKVRLVPGQ